jgi:hypothetical protein
MTWTVVVPRSPAAAVRDFVGKYGKHENHRRAAEQLLALTDPTREQVEEIIGHHYWTRERCDGCKSDDVPLVAVGGFGDYDEPCRLCERCLSEGMAFMRGLLAGKSA